MSLDIAAFHKGTRRDGEFDPFAGNDQLSRVYHDGKWTYYDVTGMNIRQADFHSFVRNTWGSDDVETTEWCRGVYRSDVD